MMSWVERQARRWSKSVGLCLACVWLMTACVIDFQQLFPPTESTTDAQAPDYKPPGESGDCFALCMAKLDDAATCKTSCSQPDSAFQVCYAACVKAGKAIEGCKASCLEPTDPVKACYAKCTDSAGNIDPECKSKCDPVTCYNTCLKAGGTSGDCWKKCSP